jgi:hypothetical protein
MALFREFQVARHDKLRLSGGHFAQAQGDRIKAQIVGAGIVDTQLYDVDPPGDGGFDHGKRVGAFLRARSVQCPPGHKGQAWLWNSYHKTYFTQKKPFSIPSKRTAPAIEQTQKCHNKKIASRRDWNIAVNRSFLPLSLLCLTLFAVPAMAGPHLLPHFHMPKINLVPKINMGKAVNALTYPVKKSVVNGGKTVLNTALTLETGNALGNLAPSSPGGIARKIIVWGVGKH